MAGFFWREHFEDLQIPPNPQSRFRVHFWIRFGSQFGLSYNFMITGDSAFSEIYNQIEEHMKIMTTYKKAPDTIFLIDSLPRRPRSDWCA